MQFKAEHIMILEAEGITKFEPVRIINPSYVYKEGDSVTLNSFLEEPSKVAFFEVINVSHEVNVSIEGEQIINVYLKEIIKQ